MNGCLASFTLGVSEPVEVVWGNILAVTHVLTIIIEDICI